MRRAAVTMRRPPAPLLLSVLVTLTILVPAKMLLQDNVPLDGWLTIRISRTLPTNQLGYTTPPSSASSLGGDFVRGEYFGYCYADWPAGEPAPGQPLPSLVTRSAMYGVAPVIPFTALAVGWASWGALWFRAR